MKFSAAEQLLRELGITEPAEIDLEAIAYHVGASLRYRPLDGCEARIIGHGDRAIITVNSRGSSRRKRFSIAHELGHWRCHKGKALVCRVDDLAPNHASSAERIADAYAADLLMPRYMFDPLVRETKKLELNTIQKLAEAFNVSMTATTLRLIAGDHFPAFAICHNRNGRKWFSRAPSVPSRWFPRDTLAAESPAFEVLFGKSQEDRHPRKVSASAWFEYWEASKFNVTEQSMRISDGEILTILLMSDGAMLQDEGLARRW